MTITRRQTGGVLLAALVALLAWEGLTVGWGDDATISRVVWGLAQSPLFSLAVGVLMGHWFWQASRCRLCGGAHPQAPTAEDRAAFAQRWVERGFGIVWSDETRAHLDAQLAAQRPPKPKLHDILGTSAEAEARARVKYGDGSR